MSYGTAFQRRLYYNSPYWLKNFISSYYGWLERRSRYSNFYHNYLTELTESQWSPNKKLRELQFEKTKSFLIHSYNHSKYYTSIFDEYGLNPKTICSPEDIARLPIQMKIDLRNQLENVIPDNLVDYRARWCHTSGTTGAALQFPISSECFQREYAFRSLHYSWGSIHLGDKLAHCSGHPVISSECSRQPFWVYDYANNWLILSSYHLGETTFKDYIAELEKFQPSYLVGYPSSIYLLAIANERCGHKVHPKAIFTTSETLLDFQRYKIEKSFGCRVFMWYGNTEMCGNIAECEQGKYHLKLEHSYVEVLDDNDQPAAPGQPGKLVCTGFGNYAFPLIRYSIGDSAIISTDNNCTCGRSGEIIQEVVGRVEDYILTPEGRLIGRLDHIFKDTNHVVLAQIEQNNIHEVIFRIVKDRSYSSADENHIIKEARGRLGRSIGISIEYVRDISRLKNGKYKFIVSHISRDELMQSSVNALA